MVHRDEKRSIAVSPESAGQRLDQYLAQVFSCTRSQVRKAIEQGLVSVNSAPAQKAGKLVAAGDVIDWQESESREIAHEDFSALKVIYEDKDLIVIDKPAGVLVHHGAGSRGQATLNGMLAAYLRSKNEKFEGYAPDAERIGIVHRIDKDTSGLLVCAKNYDVHQSLAHQFQSKTVLREYVAMLYGEMQDGEVLVENYIHRDSRNRTRFACASEEQRQGLMDGSHAPKMRFAKSSFQKKVGYGKFYSLVRVVIFTGRTHQIRVHAESIGHPVVGDQTYTRNRRLENKIPDLLKRAEADLGRQLLHAHILGFEHPVTKKKIAFKSDLPRDFENFTNLLQSEFSSKD
ncbi:MAG: RluA family pseudouridine synthase [Oligoflexales bacterium]